MRRAWQFTPSFLPGESHGQGSLAGCSPWCCRKMDMPEQCSTHACMLYGTVKCTTAQPRIENARTRRCTPDMWVNSELKMSSHLFISCLYIRNLRHISSNSSHICQKMFSAVYLFSHNFRKVFESFFSPPEEMSQSSFL